MSAYPHLEDFLGGWLHQDYDLAGRDLPDILDKACAVNGPEGTAALAADVRRFLAQEEADLDGAFERAFRPDLGPGAWRMTTAEWLGWLLREIARVQAAPPRPPPVPTVIDRLRALLGRRA